MEKLPSRFEIKRTPTGVLVEFSGDWKLSDPHPASDLIVKRVFDGETPPALSVVAHDLTSWDSSIVVAMYALSQHCLAKKIAFDYSSVPEGLKGLLDLALAVPSRGRRTGEEKKPIIERIGATSLELYRDLSNVLDFIGEATFAVMRCLTGKARVRRSDLLEIIVASGPGALPIVTLIGLLVGLILAYIGAIQLAQFGAQIYVANLVGIAMAREMGGVMAGIILAGRTGAAFAAQLGTMQVNEEIDAMKTLGINPMEFLVLPRMLALISMIPFLCLYAITAGILGGVIVSVFVLDISFPLYWEQTVKSVRLHDVWVGVGKSVVFGVLVALCGCYHGIRCGRSASAVGEATTRAVVSGIVCVVIADAVFAVLCDMVGI